MRASRYFWMLAACSWIGLLASGWYVLLRYDFTAGANGGVPERWPADSSLSLDVERSTLVLFAHRHCPCTRATLQELDALLQIAPGSARVHIVLLAPAVGASDRVSTSIEEQSRTLPDAEITIDPEGVEARRFHVRTSGHVVLFSRDGRLQFSGGITESRGHAGDNAGRRAVLASLRGEEVEQKTAPVFGCSLFGDEDEAGAEVK